MINTDIPYDFRSILSEFGIDSSTCRVIPFGSGHINSTYLVKDNRLDKPGYLLQRINDHVFKDVPLLMENIRLVIGHVQEKLQQIPGSDPEKEVLTLLPTIHSHYYFKDDLDNYWRVYLYMEGTKSYDLTKTKHQAYEGGKAFGKFQALLIDLDPTCLAEIIPSFHNIEQRLNRLNLALNINFDNRVKDCIAEITFIYEIRASMGKILAMGRENRLPLRVTHNDAKFNNVLLDRNDNAQCVIDLDTVMPGFVAYDFGDAIRTIINTSAEDEGDLEKIQLNIGLYKAYTRGYMEKTISFLTDDEIESLIYGVLLLPYMQAVRFLTDFIEGDHYFKIQFHDHNLQRARAQLQLLRKIRECQELLTDIIYKTAARSKAAYQLNLL